jgi:hypothetical protein
MGGVDDGAAGAEVEWQLVHRKRRQSVQIRTKATSS